MAIDRVTLKPRLAHRLLRSAGVRNRPFPAAKLDRRATHPRLPYAGAPSKRLLKRINVTRADIDGLPVYEVSPRLVGASLHAWMLLPGRPAREALSQIRHVLSA